MFGYWRNRNLFFSILTIILCGACSHCIASGSKQTVREKKRNVRLVPYGGSSGSGWEETSSTGQKTIGKSTTKHRSWSSITKPNKESDLITGPEEIGYFKFNETFIASSRQKKRPVVILASDTSNNTSHNGQDTFTVEQDEIVTESKARQEEPKDAIGQFHSRSLEELEDFIEYILQSWIKFDTDEIFADIRSIHGEKSDSLIKELSKKILPSIAARNERALLLISEIQEKEGLKSIFDDYIMEKFKGKRVSGEKEGVSGKITYRSFVSTTIFLLSSSDQEKSEKIHNFLTSMFEPANGKIGRYALENTVFQFFVRRLHDKEEYVPIIDFIYKKINSNRSRDLSIKKILGTFEKYGWGCKKAQDATIDYIKDLVVNMDGMSSLISGVSLHLFSYKCINILVNGNYKCVNALIDENHHHGSDNIGYRLSIDHMSQIAKLFDAISLDFIKTIDILRDLFRKLVFLDDRFASKIISTLETTFSKIKKDVDSIKKAAVYDKRERIRKFMLENPIEYGDPNAYAKEYINILRYFSGTFMKQIFVMHVAMIRDLPFSYFFEICKGIKEINEESENAAETKIFLLKLLFAETNRTFFIKLTKEMREALLTLISDKKSDLIFYLLYMLGDNVRQYVFASLSMKRDPNEKSKHPLEDDMSGLLIPNNPRAGFAFPKIANNGAGPVIKKNGVLKKDKWKYFMDRYGDKVNVWTELMWDDEYHRGDNFNKLIYLFSIWELCKLKIKRVNSFILIIFKHSDIKALFQHKFGFFFCSDTYKKFLTLEHIGSDLETLVSEAQCKHDPLALAVGGNRFFDSDKYNPFKKKVKVVLPPADQGAH